MRAWPDIERPDLVDGLVAQMSARRGRAWMLIGPAGIGKSVIAATVAERLAASGVEVLTMAGMAAFADVPLGAFVPMLAASAIEDEDEDEDEDGASTQRRLERLFGRLSRSSSRAVLVVDDAPMLDPASAAAVHQLVRAYGVRCIITTRLPVVEGPLARLVDEGLVDRIEVSGLHDDVAARAVEVAIGAGVQPESLLRLVTRAGGNPLFLRLLLEASDRDGGIRIGTRGVVIDAPVLPERILAILREPIEALEPDARRWLDLVGVAGSLPISVVAPAAVRRLERDGLLVHRGPSIATATPLVGETITALLAPDRADELRIAAAALLGDDDDERFTAVTLLADSSQPPSPTELAWASRRATQLDRYDLAIHLADLAERIAGDRGIPTPVDALIMRGEALSFLGRLDDADTAFDAAVAADGDDGELALAASRAGFHWAIRREDPPRAIALAESVLARLTDRDAIAFLTTNAAKWRIMIGDHRGGPVETGSLSGSSAASAAAAIDAGLVRLTAAIFSGDPETAREAIAAARPVVEAAAPVVRHGGELLDFGALLVLVLDGRLDDAGDLAVHRSEERFSEAGGMWSYGAALLHLHAGRLDLAADAARSAIEQLAWRDFLGARGAAIAVLATAEALLGRQGDAALTLASMPASLRSLVTADLQSAEAEAWSLARAGDTAAAAECVAAAIAPAATSGYAGWVAFAAHVAVRVGHPLAVIDVLRSAADGSSAALLQLVLEHADALIADDPDRLLAVAEALEHAGLRAGAHDAARQAISSATAAGRDDLIRRASIASARIGATLSPAPVGTAAAAVLTPREWSIATAAAARERNREIADRLGLSLRTVENHLASVYRKLGVSGRDELAEHLG